MAILNYTTKIKSDKTASEIQAILGKAGAQAVMSEYKDGEVSAISFRFEMDGQLLSFLLPINKEGVLRALERDCKQRFVNPEQASRTAWRIIKDWVEAQMALVDANQADVVEVFLSHLQKENGKTIYQSIKEGGFKQLTHQG